MQNIVLKIILKKLIIYYNILYFIKFLMNKQQYFHILKQLHDVCRDLPVPVLTGMDAYNEIMNYLYLRHLSDNNNISDEFNLRTLYNNFCTDNHIEKDLHNSNFNKTNRMGTRKLIYFEKLSDIFLPGLDNERNKNVYFVKIMGSEILDFKLSVGRLTNIINTDGITHDGGQKAQKIINKLYQNGFLPTDDNNKFNISMFPYDAVGEGFEKFMNDAGSKGGNWGQYFTNIQIINWIVNKVNLKKIIKQLILLQVQVDLYYKQKKYLILKKKIFMLMKMMIKYLNFLNLIQKLLV